MCAEIIDLNDRIARDPERADGAGIIDRKNAVPGSGKPVASSSDNSSTARGCYRPLVDDRHTAATLGERIETCGDGID